MGTVFDRHVSDENFDLALKKSLLHCDNVRMTRDDLTTYPRSIMYAKLIIYV